MRYVKNKYEVLGPIRILRKGNFTVGDVIELTDSEYFHLNLLYRRRLKKLKKVVTASTKKPTTASVTKAKPEVVNRVRSKPITSKK